MPTNRLVVKEEVLAYARAMFDAAYEAGGQDAVLEVRSQMEEIILLMHSDMDLSMALSDVTYSPEAAAFDVIWRTPCSPIATRLSAVLCPSWRSRGDAE